MAKARDTQVGGGHYKDMKIQPVEFIHANGLGFCEGAVIKYVVRWRNKNGVEDLKKARHFIDLLIELEQAKEAERQDAQVQETIDSMSAPKCARDGDCDVMAGPAPGTRAPNLAMACGFCGSLEHDICSKSALDQKTNTDLNKPLY